MGFRRIVVPLCLAASLLDGTAAFRAPASLTSARLGARPATCAARPASLGLRMGFFDGLAKAVNDGMTVQGATKPAAVDPSTFSGWIERSGMQAFTFDGVPAGEIPVSGAISMAGRQAGAKPKEKEGIFAMFNAEVLPPAKENQDGVLAIPNIYDGVGMYLVFDGHGEFGLSVSQWVEANLPAYLAGALAEGRAGELLNRVTDAYRLADVALTEAIGYDQVEDSGTTAACVMVKGTRILVAGLGDSRVVLGVDNRDGTLGAQAVTLDQSPIVPAEEKRIIASGGEVRDEGTSGRIYAAGQPWPGLAVSRAFGDADAKQYGVTVDPQFIGWTARPGTDFCIILASDGVWNAIGNDAAVAIAADFRATKDSKAAAQAIVTQSRLIWEELARGRIDDITALVLYL